RPNHLKKLRERFDRKYIVFDETYHRLSPEENKEMFSSMVKSFHKENNPYRADNHAQAFYARKTGAAFSREMARSTRVALKKWDGRLLDFKKFD
ncbi:MAG: nitroreductase, partial [Negativibacillus sp.]|nr:nitroreductase [Negativibacillus sp.]